MKIISKELPEEYKKDVMNAVSILKKFGCTDIYIFGSLAKGGYTGKSDVDFAVRGLPAGKYFKVSAILNMELEHGFDLIKIDDDDDPFSNFIKETEVFLRVA